MKIVHPQVIDIMGVAHSLATPHSTGHVKHSYRNNNES